MNMPRRYARVSIQLHFEQLRRTEVLVTSVYTYAYKKVDHKKYIES